MAERRMFSKKITSSDAFLSMPHSTQALYYRFCMEADDDGVVANPRVLMRSIDTKECDLKRLIEKRFVFSFDSGVIIIKHWKINNNIRKDRYSPSQYQNELASLYIKPNGAYTDHPVNGVTFGIPSDNQMSPARLPSGIPSDNHVVDPGKDRLGKGRLGEDRLGKVSTSSSSYLPPSSRTRACEAEPTEAGDGDLSDAFAAMSEENQARIANIAGDLFVRYTSRDPTYQDYLNVYAWAVTRNGPEIEISTEAAQLLAYAMEQAVDGGHPGNWGYIRGTLRNLAARGIHTAQAAREAEDDRIMEAAT